VKLKSLFCALALFIAAMPLAADAQTVPNWNVTLPAAPGTSTQKVTLTSSSLTINSVFSQSKFREVVPLKSIKSITQPYLYTNKNWLIDLKVSPKVTTVNTITVVNSVQTDQVDEVSLQFLKRADAAAARAYLLAHLH
jgi:biopolymer transport protein ExbD